MSFFGRRREDVVPVPEPASGKAILEINKIAEYAVFGLAAIFFGTMWQGVSESSKRLVQIEGDLKTLATTKDVSLIQNDVTLLKQQATAGILDRGKIREEIEDLEIRLRTQELRKQ